MFPDRYFPRRYFAPRYFPRNGGIVPPIPTPDVGGGVSGGRPWPQKLVNVILPYRVMIDDEDVLIIIGD